MGEWMRSRNTKWSEEDERKLAAIQCTLHLENRSQAVRATIRFMYELITMGILHEIFTWVQELQRAQSVRTYGDHPGPRRAIPNRRACDVYRWMGISTSEDEARECMEMFWREAS